MKYFFKLLWWAMWNYKWCLKCHKMRVHNNVLGTDACIKCGYNRQLNKYINEQLEDII